MIDGADPWDENLAKVIIFLSSLPEFP